MSKDNLNTSVNDRTVYISAVNVADLPEAVAKGISQSRVYSLNSSNGERLALVGDSAQNMHPIAGQGVNLGIRDVACLAEVVILGFRLGEDIGSLHLLRRYEQWRRLDTTLLFAATDSVNRFFSNNNSLLNFGSSIGMKVIDNIPYIKRLLMYEAMGVNGDLPKLLRGFVP